jgi:hypothetical protein
MTHSWDTGLQDLQDTTTADSTGLTCCVAYSFGIFQRLTSKYEDVENARSLPHLLKSVLGGIVRMYSLIAK